ncbi:hypothetical protein G4D61_05290 [Bacillus ginsengihumi]|uniref:CDP-glycerol glycerophosphotransferase n=1 Tax=Heyndrickxia ginsengihumi TaxID=363870 RepID=A0A6M0P3V1_9BACI|nr:CDP-glycerol glycerophosphotransferase family protein [Heyndrickxia ginsengihumi]NEY19382.1 hypothetical protein [Heyndrickxia ginsengihumi]
MDFFEISFYTLRENFLIMTIEDEKFPVENFQLLFVNRESKKIQSVTPEIENNKNGKFINIDLNGIYFDDKSKNIIDLYINRENKKIKIKYNTVNLKTRVNKYLPNEYRLNSNRVVVPYLTKLNTLSLLYGNATEVFKSYCNKIDEKITAQNVEFNQNNVILTFKENLLNINNSPLYLAVQNKKDNSIVGITFEILSANPLKLQFPFESIRDLKHELEYYLYLIQKNGGYNLVKYRIGLDQNISEESQRFFNSFEINRTKKILPYITSKGELSFLIGNDEILDKRIYSVVRNDVYIDQFSLNNKTLKISLKESDNIDFQGEYAIYIKNRKSSDVITLNTEEVLFDPLKREININLLSLFDKNNIFELNQRWFLYVKFYKEEQVIISQVKKEGIWVESALQRHMSPLEINKDLSLIVYISGKNELGILCGDQSIYNREVYKKLSGYTNIHDIRLIGTNIHFSINNYGYNMDNLKLAIIFKERKTKEEWKQELNYKSKDGLISIILNLDSFIQEYKTKQSRWDLYLEIQTYRIIETNRIGYFDAPVKPAYDRFLDSIITDTPNSVTPYLTSKNELSIVVKPEINLNSEKVKADMKLTKFKMRGPLISGQVSLKLHECNVYEVTSVMLKYRDKIEVVEYKFEAKEKKDNTNNSQVFFKVDLSSLELQNYYWDLFVVVKINNREYALKIKNPTKEVKKAIDKKVVRYSYTDKNGFLIYPYVTSVNTLAIGYKEKEAYESTFYKIKENLAYYTYRLFKNYFNNKGIWLGYEKFSEGAQDNGYYFFKYCYENSKRKNFYYIIKESSPDYSNVIGMKDKVLKFMSFKYMLYMFAAELLISSESKGHSYDIRIEKGRLKKALKNKKQVFLQHGVTALKRVDYVFNKNSTHAVDLFVATSDYEKNIIKNNFGYNDNEIITTGFCRWDVLKDLSGEEKIIFLMPTWRTWMDDLPESKFRETEYYKKYVGFLNSNVLVDFLETENIILQFYIHPKFKAYIDNFKTNSKNIKILQYGEEKVNELLMKSSLLITDYSSVAWEMFYMKKPVIFYQFDIEDYNNFQGSYLDMENDLFGDRVFDVDQLVKMVKDYYQRDFKEKPNYGLLRSKYFKYVDNKNCERTYKAIMDKKKKNIL